ncbi:MAG: hypothetical protein WBW33_25385 [Bryobacteraceae bacterium]
MGIRFETDAVIHGISKSLFAPKVALGCLDAHVSEQKLDLLQLSASLMT